MALRVLDTNILINFWGDCRRKYQPAQITEELARAWGRELVTLQGTRAILTPIYIEYVAGKCSELEVIWARAYLSVLHLIDDGNVTDADWRNAKRIAARVPARQGRRQLGDCLIRAISERLHHEVTTMDKRFPD